MLLSLLLLPSLLQVSPADGAVPAKSALGNPVVTFEGQIVVQKRLPVDRLAVPLGWETVQHATAGGVDDVDPATGKRIYLSSMVDNRLGMDSAAAGSWLDALRAGDEPAAAPETTLPTDDRLVLAWHRTDDQVHLQMGRDFTAAAADARTFHGVPPFLGYEWSMTSTDSFAPDGNGGVTLIHHRDPEEAPAHFLTRVVEHQATGWGNSSPCSLGLLEIHYRAPSAAAPAQTTAEFRSWDNLLADQHLVWASSTDGEWEFFWFEGEPPAVPTE